MIAAAAIAGAVSSDHDAPEDVEGPAAIDHHRLIELHGDGVHGLLDHPDGDRHREGHLRQDQRGQAVDEPEAREDAVDRDDQERRGHHLGREDKEAEESPTTEPEP